MSKKTLVPITTGISRDIDAEFRAIALREGKTAYKLLRELILEHVAKDTQVTIINY